LIYVYPQGDTKDSVNSERQNNLPPPQRYSNHSKKSFKFSDDCGTKNTNRAKERKSVFTNKTKSFCLQRRSYIFILRVKISNIPSRENFFP